MGGGAAVCRIDTSDAWLYFRRHDAVRGYRASVCRTDDAVAAWPGHEARRWHTGSTLSVIAAFFFFGDGAWSETGRSAARRAAGERGHRLLAVAEMTISGVVYGMLGTALAQERSPHLDSGSRVPARSFGLITSLLSFIPMGPPLVWLPSTLWLFSNGEIGWGIFMGAMGPLRRQHRRQHHSPYFIIGSALPLILVFLGLLGGIAASVARRVHWPDAAPWRLYLGSRMEPLKGT